MAQLIVTVNKDDCTSCNQCALNLPNYFRMDANDLSESHNNGENLNKAIVAEADKEAVQNEIDQCPAECIAWA